MKISISVDGIEKAVGRIANLEKDLNMKCDEFANRLGQLGVRIATMYYAQAPYAGTNDVEVTLDETGKLGTAQIVAGGDAVLFIEFGTGVTMPDAFEARGELVDDSGIVYHGQWGDKKASNPKGWYFPLEGVSDTSHLPDGTKLVGHYNRTRHQTEYYWKTRGNPAFPAMYMTRNDLIDSIERIAREVFKL